MAPQPSSKPEFDSPNHYERQLEQGIRLSGEARDYFIRGRIAELVRRLPREFRPRRILDFGCGTGETCRALLLAFPGAAVVGADTSETTLRWAAARHGRSVTFTTVADLRGASPFDLCYVNGVLHHVPRAQQHGVLQGIRNNLSTGGYLAIFDNNPLNPGARLVMKRIPFDRQAVMLCSWRVRRALQAAGFRTLLPTSYLFFFPRILAPLRVVEPRMSRLPLGAQYCVLGQNT
jgi:SAM-dependent methyltransferase